MSSLHVEPKPGSSSDRQHQVEASDTSTSDGARMVDDPRVYLAAERTFLAWVRTSLALMGFGFLIARFSLMLRGMDVETRAGRGLETYSPWLGFAMIVFGVGVCVASLLRHHDYIRKLKRGDRNPSPSLRMPILVSAILALVGLAMAVTVLTL